MRDIKLSGGALLYAILIAMVLAVLTGAMIVYYYFGKLDVARNEQYLKLHRNAISGLNLFVNEPNWVSGKEELIDLFGFGNDSIRCRKWRWGAFNAVSVTAWHRDLKYTMSGLYGLKFNDSIPALYLADLNKPLSVSGSTFIKGACFLPESGVKRSYIDGNSFSGKSLINGSIEISEERLPELNADIQESIRSLYSGDISKDCFSSDIEDVNVDSEVVSFSSVTKHFYSLKPIVLNGENLTGNIIIESDISIQVKAGTRLNGCILFAPVIQLDEGCVLSAQFYAKDSLIVHKNCKLNYPTVLALINKDLVDSHGKLVIASNCEVSGFVLSNDWDDSDLIKPATIYVDENSWIEGFVYSSGNFELKSIIKGSVYANQFILETHSSLYENHLLNATIDRSKLPIGFEGILINTNHSKLHLLKWIES